MKLQKQADLCYDINKCKYIARHNNRMRCISKTRLPSEHDSKHVIKKQYPHTWRM